MSLSPEQLDARKGRLGSTDMAAVAAFYRPELAHLAKKKNAADIWLRLVCGIDQPSKGLMNRGSRMEPMLRALFRRTVGDCSEPVGTLLHRSCPWACGSPDGLGSDGSIVELKTCSNWVRAKWGRPSTDEVPDDYAIQCQWMMSVTDSKLCVVLVAFGDDVKPTKPPAPEEEDCSDIFVVTDTAVYLLRKDEALCASLLDLGGRFMADFVHSKTPPTDLAPLWNKRKFKALTKEKK